MAPRRFFLPRVATTALAALFALFVANALAGCVQVQCTLNSDCPAHSSCIMSQCISRCMEDRDCPMGQSCNLNGVCVAGSTDAGTDAVAMDTPAAMDVRMDAPMPIDNVMPPTDTPMPVDNVMPPIDTPMPPVDVPTMGTRRYLDSCGSDSDCASGMCTTTAPRYCTRSCSVGSDCADGQLCVGSRCQLDDTGTRGCNTTTGAPCLQYCYGSATISHCTHECTSTAQCPAGYACAPSGSLHVCVQIEIPCNGPGDCPSGLGFCGAGGVGCTSNCTTAADCPQRLPGLPPYTCVSMSGQMVCTTTTDVMGSDPIGTPCSSTGFNTCRSTACNDNLTPAQCTEACTSRGGCGPGFGCYPEASGSEYLFVCRPTGSAWLGEACAHSSDCRSGLCDLSGVCTRLCNDGLCPTSLTCRDSGARSADGVPIRFCQP